MKIKLYTPFVYVIIFVIGPLTSGCKIFIPAHSNSNCRQGERVSIELITTEQALTNDQFVANYQIAFGHKPGDVPTTKAIPLLAPLAAAAVGMAVDYVKKSLDEEAKLYVAQFGTTIGDDKFWHMGGDGPEVHYVGMNVKRDLVDSKGRVINAYNLLCGFCPTFDKHFITVKPLVFSTHKAKAKVVGDGILAWLPAAYPKIFLKPGHEIDSSAEFNIDGYFKDQSQQMQIIPMGAFKFKFPSYSLSKPAEMSLIATNQNLKLSNQTSGFINTAPYSIVYDQNDNKYKPDQESAFTGVFTVKVIVTEQDTSNAKENLEKLSTLVSEQKTKLVELVNPKQ